MGSDGPWVKRSRNGGNPKVVHTDPDCFQLNGSRPVEEATEMEAEEYRECEWCSGVVEPGGKSGPDLARILHDIGRGRR